MDVLFYEYGIIPLKKEFENYDKKVSALMKAKGFDYATGFIAWQLFKLRKLTEKLNEDNIKKFAKQQPKEELNA